MNDLSTIQLPCDTETLFPVAARHYLDHTRDGRSIREIARDAACHASTVLRQVRKIESLRDDPLLDKALSLPECAEGPAESTLQAAAHAMRDLCARSTMLVFTQDVAKPAIMQTTGDGDTKVVSVVDTCIAAGLLLRGWIGCTGGGAVKTYTVTQDGRTALPGLVATLDNLSHRNMDRDVELGTHSSKDRRSRDRSVMNGPGSDSPLTVLARRKSSDGAPFLSRDLVAAGDQLSTDFQIAAFNTSELLGWDAPDALAPFADRAKTAKDKRQSEAMSRVIEAIRDLGPGLSDVALRCCCLREGLEATEKRMGWSARSGKVVLRIALQRLSLHYAATLSKEGVLIG